MEEEDPWIPLLEFGSRGSAEAVAAVLQAEQIPTHVASGRLVAGIEAQFVLSVPQSLAHRARWLLEQSDFTEDELAFLATGELPGAE